MVFPDGSMAKPSLVAKRDFPKHLALIYSALDEVRELDPIRDFQLEMAFPKIIFHFVQKGFLLHIHHIYLAKLKDRAFFLGILFVENWKEKVSLGSLSLSTENCQKFDQKI